MAKAEIELDYQELRYRVWANTVPADGDYEAQTRSRVEWLEGASPDDWHRFAIGFNWDDDFAPLFWIVQQEQCEMAAALYIFWNSCPGWNMMLLARGEKVYDRAEEPMVAFIAKRIAAKGYKRRKIAWDPQPMMRREYDEIVANVAKIGNPAWTPHRDLLRSIWGKEVMDNEDAWKERPAGVRTGFWIDLPPSGIITSVMQEARDEMRTVFLNLFVIGAVLAAFGEFANDPAKYWLYFVGGVVMVARWTWVVKDSTQTARSLMRSEMKLVPTRQLTLIYVGLLVSGALWLNGYFAVNSLFVEAKDTSFNARAINTVICAACLLSSYFVTRWLAQQYTYRWLFR